MKDSYHRKADRWIWALGLIFLIYALGSCARGPTRPTAPEVVEGVPVKITGISFLEEPRYTRVVVEGSEPLKYTFFKLLTDPLRIAIDVPNGEFEDISVPIEVNNGTLTEINVSQYEDKGTIEIGLTQTVNYNITKVEKKLFVDVERGEGVEVAKERIEMVEEKIPPEPLKPKAEKITQVLVDKGEKAVHVTLVADGAVGDYKSFKLEKPARLVIDIWNVKKGYPKNLVQVDHPLLKRVRLGAHPKKTRFVFDAARPQVPQFQINRTEAGLVISFGHIEEAPPKAEGLATLTGIDFKQMDHRSRIVVSTSEVATYEVVKISETAVALDLKKMRVPKKFKRGVDTKAFQSAVDYISLYNVKSETSKDVRIIVRLREAVDFETTQEGNRIYLDFEKPAKPAPPGRAEKSGETPESRVAEAEMTGGEEEKPESQVAEAEPAKAEEKSPEKVEPVEKTATAEKTEPAEAEKEKTPPESQKAAKEVPLPPKKVAKKGEIPPEVLREQESVLETLAAQRRYTGRKLSLDFKDADIKNIIRLIAEVSNLNIIAGDDVKGKVTIRLVDVPWDQALDIILQSSELGKVRVGNVIRVAPVEKLKKEEEDILAARRAKEKLEDLSTELIPVNYATAKDLETQVKEILTDRGSVTVDERTNMLVVKDIGSAIGEAKTLVASLDAKTPQILIEARVVEANASYTRELGVRWGGTATKIHGTTADPKGTSTISGALLGSDTLIDLPVADPGGAISFGWLSSTAALRSLDIELQALEDSGEGKVISSPRIATLDNTEASIERGDRIPYLKLSEEGTATTEFIEANLKLTVTPHVTNDGNIKLKIKVSNDEPDFEREVLGVPTIRKKEAITEVLVRDNDIIVIAGVYDIDEGTAREGIPFFSRVPLFGWLFKYEQKSLIKEDLLIFISPKILKDVV
jgi:type IV pilus assembly protein PilQ